MIVGRLFQMQKTEIHWSPNDRNQLAEIGAEIIIHTFDRPLTGESGKCLSGGTNRKTTNLNYPLNEKSHIKVRLSPHHSVSMRGRSVSVLCLVALARASLRLRHRTTERTDHLRKVSFRFLPSLLLTRHSFSLPASKIDSTRGLKNERVTELSHSSHRIDSFPSR